MSRVHSEIPRILSGNVLDIVKALESDDSENNTTWYVSSNTGRLLCSSQWIQVSSKLGFFNRFFHEHTELSILAWEALLRETKKATKCYLQWALNWGGPLPFRWSQFCQFRLVCEKLIAPTLKKNTLKTIQSHKNIHNEEKFWTNSLIHSMGDYYKH